jgi:hypothetical protein
MRDGERAEVYPWKDSPEEQSKFFARLIDIFRREGGDAWYARPAEDFLPPDADRRGFGAFEKETDILDVWFDSGVSHLAVLRSGEWPELVVDRPGPPADVYLEGHDQHRGWFQSSLLTSVALYGDAPYRAVITHGFFQDVSGRKMSKSLGNVVEPQELIRRYGADILRLWVFSLDYRDDSPISEEILARCAEAYRKIRNTARYLISNLYDFDPAADAVPFDALEPLGGADARPGPRAFEPTSSPRLSRACGFRRRPLGVLLDIGPALRRGASSSDGPRRRPSIESPGPSLARGPILLHGRGDLAGPPEGKSVHLSRLRPWRPPEAFRRGKLGKLSEEEAAVMLEQPAGTSRSARRSRGHPLTPATSTSTAPTAEGPGSPTSSSCRRHSRRPGDGGPIPCLPGLRLGSRPGRRYAILLEGHPELSEGGCDRCRAVLRRPGVTA